MNFSEMTDEQINELVITALVKNGVFTDDYREVSHREYVSCGWNWGRGTETGMTGRDGNLFISHQNGRKLDYCNSWTDAGPIIEKHRIAIKPVALYVGGYRWFASVGEDDLAIKAADHNPLRAAMIVFLMMQEGA
ncbi:phage protein NinX family protein [Pantoea dispersa]